jgi:SAM-dependent methyltransferase
VSLRDTFDTVAEQYDAARPDYSPELFDDLVELARLKPVARLLEVGCATGKATRPLLARGFDVTCVELGANLAAVARRMTDATIHVAPFESWQGEPHSFELVFAATAWHWLDHELRYGKAHEQLRAGGHLALWSASHALPPGFDPFFAEIQEVYDAIGESHPGEWPPADPADDADEIAASGYFERPVVRRYVWAIDYSADEYIALLDTFSGHIAMPDASRERLYTEIRGRLGARAVRRHWQALLHVARAV